MTTIRLSANDQDLKIIDLVKLASGNKETVALQVRFSPEWDGYTTSAVFFSSTAPDDIYEMLLTEGRCTIPHEVLAVAGELVIGIRGAKPDAVKVSDRIKYTVVDGAPTGTATAQGPTPDVYQQILEKLNDVTGVNPEDIKKAVAEYLAANPITETDPTVPEWAKQEEKPSYTANEVGALSAETLAGAVNDALAQAKESGEFDGKPGQPGKDGIDGNDGAPGAPGEPGRTPQKGIDYYTEADKQEMVTAVLDAMPTWDGGAY